MTAHLPLETVVADWLRGDAPDHAAPDILAGALDRVATTRQQRYVTQSLFGDRIGRAPQLRWALVVALLVVTVAGVIALAGTLLPPPPSPVRLGWQAYTLDAGSLGTSATGISRDVWLVREGAPPQRILGADSDGVDHACPAFSPAGDRLLWTASVSPTQVVVLMAVVRPTGALDQPTGVADVALQPDQRLSCPKWSPDGRRVALIAGPEVRVVDVASGGSSVLALAEADGAPADLDWAPDSRQLVVTVRSRIDIVPVTGTGDPPRVLARATTSPDLGTQEFDAVRWSPDGTRIAVWGENHPSVGGSFIQSITVATGEATDLATGRSYAGPAWSPDGTWLAFIQDRSRLVVVSADGSRSRELTPHDPAADGSTGGIGSEPVWSARGDRIQYAVWRGDGSHDPANDVWALVVVDLEPGAIPELVVPFGPHHLYPTSWQEGS
jgi:hypothetical protein